MMKCYWRFSSRTFTKIRIEPEKHLQFTTIVNNRATRKDPLNFHSHRKARGLRKKKNRDPSQKIPEQSSGRDCGCFTDVVPFSTPGRDFRARIFGTKIPGFARGRKSRRNSHPTCRRARGRRRRSRGAASRGRRSREDADTRTSVQSAFARDFSLRERVPPFPSRGSPSRRARNRTSALYSGSLYL